MARPNKIVATGSGSGITYSTPYPTNWRRGDPSIALGLDTTGSTTTATIQHTFDDPVLTPVDDWTWFDHETLVDITAKDDGNYSAQVTALRLKLGATGTDTWTMFIVEG